MARPKLRIEFLFGLVCDDVRREDTGKEILIGVYTGAIVVPKLPSQTNLFVWLSVQTHGSGEVPLAFRVLGPDDAEIVHAVADVEFEGTPDTSSLTVPKLPVKLEQEGQLRFQWKQGRSDWETLLVKEVRLKERPKQVAGR